MIFAVCGFLGGILGGMGMGGGTALIPLLTIFCGVQQNVAQGMNLLSFLPMSLLALAIHAKNGLLVKDKLAWIVVPALVFSVLGSLCAAFLPARALRSSFGVFLIILSFTRFYAARKMQVKEKAKE
ncbi:MAG: sulfite exporter TauE/SafE family protein [Clostridia bacterium]|nr:sulfite exporter TauE/SafE family protein [Clostridia bacterium]